MYTLCYILKIIINSYIEHGLYCRIVIIITDHLTGVEETKIETDVTDTGIENGNLTTRVKTEIEENPS